MTSIWTASRGGLLRSIQRIVWLLVALAVQPDWLLIKLTRNEFPGWPARSFQPHRPNSNANKLISKKANGCSARVDSWWQINSIYRPVPIWWIRTQNEYCTCDKGGRARPWLLSNRYAHSRNEKKDNCPKTVQLLIYYTICPRVLALALSSRKDRIRSSAKSNTCRRHWSLYVAVFTFRFKNIFIIVEDFITFFSRGGCFLFIRV